MARTIIEAERILPYAPADLCRLVGDVRAYPSFIPWLKTMRILEEHEKLEGGWEGKAEAIVGWRAFEERFTSQIRCEPAKGEVDVSLVRGPFRALENRWRFEPHERGARVRYWISYEFKNPLLQTAVSANREKLAARIMDAFVKEAQRRLGKQLQ
ncbi:MAG: type II toxin-antitoxin system RatA family toxin [Pseudomonadota bacterium]